MPGRRIAIFVHGCFWHAHRGCKFAKTPSTRTQFWTTKLQANVERDRQAIEGLVTMGWRVLCVWECATRDLQALQSLKAKIVDWIAGCESTGEIGGSRR